MKKGTGVTTARNVLPRLNRVVVSEEPEAIDQLAPRQAAIGRRKAKATRAFYLGVKQGLTGKGYRDTYRDELMSKAHFDGWCNGSNLRRGQGKPD